MNFFVKLGRFVCIYIYISHIFTFTAGYYPSLWSTRLVVEFGGDFLLQRHPTRAYDISFPFSTVCIKKAHQAIEAASYKI